MPDERDWSSISSFFREVFTADKPTKWKINHILFNNDLTSNGDIKRIIELNLESNIDNLDYYLWKIPLPDMKCRRVHGLIVRNASNELLPYDIDYLTRKHKIVESQEADYANLKIHLNPIKKGERITFSFEYFLEKYSKRIRLGIFSTKWKYCWAYRVHSETLRFEHRLTMPKNCKIKKNGLTTNMKNQPLKFSFGEKDTAIWMEDSLNIGDLSGEVIYKKENLLAMPILSIFSGGIIGAITVCLTTSLTSIQIFLLFFIPSIVTFLILLLSKLFLPTFK